MNKKKILAISGSTRKNSTNENILRLIATLTEQQLEITMYDGLAALPHFNPDLDHEPVDSRVKNLRTLIQKADGVIICTPEYIFSLPGVLKNAIEWTVSTTVFLDKPTAVIVASGLGEKTYESLLLIMETVGARIGADSKLLIPGARAKFDASGHLADENTLAEIKKLIDSFTATLN